MYLLYLSEKNLRNKSFIIDLVHHFKPPGKGILLHDRFGSIADTRFVTKRISALLSEGMIVNQPLSGDQRNLLKQAEGGIKFNQTLTQDLFKVMDLLVMNTILPGAATADPLEVIPSIRSAYPDIELILFPDNSKSALTAEAKRIYNTLDAENLFPVFEEEKETLERASTLAPVMIASPSNCFA